MPACCFALLLVSGVGTAVAESMRCGKWVVSESVALAELVEKCGEPQDKNSTTEDVLARNANGTTRKIGTRTVEHWTYQPGPGALPMTVVIIDGKVTRMERSQ